VSQLLGPNAGDRRDSQGDVVKAILESLGLSAEAPPIRPARSPPEPGLVEYDLD
jgi:hypothetical protein